MPSKPLFIRNDDGLRCEVAEALPSGGEGDADGADGAHHHGVTVEDDVSQEGPADSTAAEIEAHDTDLGDPLSRCSTPNALHDGEDDEAEKRPAIARIVSINLSEKFRTCRIM